MPIRVTCPNCRQILSAPDELAGKQARCINCEEVLMVPQPEERESHRGRSGVRTDASPRPTGITRGILFVVCVVVVGVLTIVALKVFKII